MGNHHEVRHKPNLEGKSCTCRAEHLGDIGAMQACTFGDFGSGNVGGASRVHTASWGEPANEVLLTHFREHEELPSFCGGEGEDTTMDNQQDVQMEDEPQPAASPMEGSRSSLDYVVQNLQCRLGNYRNRCFANGPFIVGMGWQLHERTSAMEPHPSSGTRGAGGCGGTTLETLATLWETFNEAVQDDAAHFLQQLVELGDSKNVIRQYHHVDFRQEVHLRAAFPTHLIYPEDGGEEFETLISTWTNTADGQVLAGRGLWVAQIGRYAHRHGEWTKHHKALQVPTIFQLPVCLDGETTRTEQYSLIGLPCHSGDAHLCHLRVQRAILAG